jgi:hypothetical protein
MKKDLKEEVKNCQMLQRVVQAETEQCPLEF